MIEIPKSGEGSFVKTLKGETGTGFAEGTHVHKDWWAKCITHDQALEKSESAVRSRSDFLLDFKKMEPKVLDGKLQFIHPDGKGFEPTDHCLNQMGAYFNISTHFLRCLRTTSIIDRQSIDRDEQDAKILVDVIKNEQRKYPDKKRKFRAYSDGTLRAFLSEQYAYIDNRWYIETLKKVVPDGRWSHFYGDEDNLRGNLLIPDTMMDYGQDDSDYGGMVTCKNSEVGNGSISETPSLFRAICMNGCIFGQSLGEQRKTIHKGKVNLLLLARQIEDNIKNQIPLLPDYFEIFFKTKDRTFRREDVLPVVASSLSSLGTTKKENVNILKAFSEEPMYSQFGIANAVTRAAQKLSYSQHEKLDQEGGKVISWSENKWDSIVKSAQKMDEKDIKKVLSV